MKNNINWIDERFLQEINDYKFLIENFRTFDATDRTKSKSKINWQIKCNDYFHNGRVAQSLGKDLLKKHYELLEAYKNLPTPISFKEALKNLYEQTGNISPFLASQAVHFFNPDMPICSRFVLDGLSISVCATNIEETCKDYERLTDAIHEFRNTEKGQEIIQDFRQSFNERMTRYITDTKIIDFYFWFNTLIKDENNGLENFKI